MPEKIKIFPPTLLEKYPHMLPVDARIWHKYLEENASLWDGFMYDVHVGNIPALPPDLEPNMVRAANILLSKRIDAIGIRSRERAIIEVKPYAGMSALGQVISYETLFLDKFPVHHGFTKKIIITDIADHDLDTIATPHDVTIFEVGPVSLSENSTAAP